MADLTKQHENERVEYIPFSTFLEKTDKIVKKFIIDNGGEEDDILILPYEYRVKGVMHDQIVYVPYVTKPMILKKEALRYKPMSRSVFKPENDDEEHLENFAYSRFTHRL